MKKNLLLSGISILLITVFFLLPPNRKWLQSRILNYYSEFPYQVRQWDIEKRKTSRWGSSYVCSKQIATFFEQKGIKKNVLVLIPPTTFLKARGLDYFVPEPAVFYYYTGLKTIWTNSPDALKANWLVRAVNGKLVIDSVSSPGVLADTLRAINQYHYAL